MKICNLWKKFLQKQQANQFKDISFFGMLCLSVGPLIGPNRFLAEIHNETLIRMSNMEWNENGGEGYAGMRMAPARKLHVYETLDLNLKLYLLETKELCYFGTWNVIH